MTDIKHNERLAAQRQEAISAAVYQAKQRHAAALYDQLRETTTTLGEIVMALKALFAREPTECLRVWKEAHDLLDEIDEEANLRIRERGITP